MTKKSKYILFLLVWTTTLFGSQYSHAQKPVIKSIGIPFMNSYRTKDYSSKEAIYGSQNFDVLVGNDGKMYFANIEGLLIFDGVNWIRFRLPGRAGVYSLAKAKDGTIYIGAINEIGYLSTNSIGQLQYNSLRDKLGKVSEESFTCRFSFTRNDEIIFTDDRQIFIFNHLTREMKTIDSPEANLNTLMIQGILHTYRGDSLFKLNARYQWENAKYSTLLNSHLEGKILSIDITDEESIIITTTGFFDFKTGRKITINQDVEHFLNNTVLNSINLLYEKYVIICTNKGVLITDLSGNPIQLLNQPKGLTDNITFSTTIDNSGLLWIGTNSGINSVEIFSPFTLFDERSGIDGNVSFIEKYGEDIYLASATGTYRQKWSDMYNPLKDISFEKLDPQVSRFLINSKEALLSLASHSTLLLENGKLKKIAGSGEERYWVGMKYSDSNDILLGSTNGKIIHLSKEGGKWTIKKELSPLVNSIIYMAEGEGQNIWVCNRNEVFKLEYDKTKSEIISQKKYGLSDGLPFNVDNYVFTIDSKPCFTTLKGIYKYDSDSDRFVQDERFISTVGDMPLLRITDDSEGNIYCLSDGYLILKKTNDGYKMTRLLNEKLVNYNPFNIIAVDSVNVFLPTFNAFVHVDPTVPQLQQGFDAKITNIRSIGLRDSLYFDGFGLQSNLLQLAYTNNAIRFGFSADFYQNIDQNVYKWRLNGMDKEWSSWSSETTKDYTNLSHGEYTFEVVAKNINGIESSLAVVPFTVSTPWFHTYWAYSFYALLAYLFVLTIVKINTKRLKVDKLKLEEIVKERTLEISQQKETVERDALIISEQNNKLVQMDELKSRFFLNISHELRTPLTLTMGTVDLAIQGKYGKLNDDLQSNLKVSLSNSKRLLKMVNNILDVSKLEGGQMKINPEKVNPYKILSSVLDFFSSKFVQKGISLKSELIQDVELYIDKDKFETVFVNLLANAYKFVGQNGVITVAMKQDQSSVHIIVNDNGIGIPQDDLQFVFDRFYQSSLTKNGEGTGLGLTLSKELVELHKGKITVSSDSISGTTFKVTLLKGKDHLSISERNDTVNSEISTIEEKFPLHEVSSHEENEALIETEKVASTEKLHLLLVEDNPEMSGFIRSLLSEDYNISWVDNGLKGLEFLKDQKPDLIITDYLMPEMDGFEMATEIKKSEDLAFIPIIFLTARAQEQDKINVLNLGVDDYLYKPFNAEELKVRIKNLLNTKKQRAAFLLEEIEEPVKIEWKEFPSKLKVNIDVYIKDHITEEITGEELATFTGQSERSLYRKIKANTGLSLMQYIKEYRLRTARTMLESKTMHTVAEVSYAVGFNYQSHFAKNYKERFGKNPSEYLD